MDSVGVGFPSIEAQDFDSVEALRQGTRQPVFRVARLLMKPVAGRDFFRAVLAIPPAGRTLPQRGSPR